MMNRMRPGCIANAIALFGLCIAAFVAQAGESAYPTRPVRLLIPFDRFPTVFVGGDPASQKKTAKEIAELAKTLKVDAIITGNGG